MCAFIDCEVQVLASLRYIRLPMKKLTERTLIYPRYGDVAKLAKDYLDCSDELLQKLRDEAMASFARIDKKIWYLKSSIDECLYKRMIAAVD